jgi:muramidase (phage lysozyme)
MNLVAYNPSDPKQASFLSALALGESGGKSNAATLGYGGSDLSSAPSGEHGFPSWTGLGNSHAAGIYQFQPKTWDALASKFGFDFHSPQDQSAAAWVLAQQTYASKTGGSLSDALDKGNYGAIQSALAKVWPSVTGNGSAPQGLAANLAAGVGASIPGASSAEAIAGGSGNSSAPLGIIDAIDNWFVRFGLVAVGGLILIAATWALLSNAGYVPSAHKLVKEAL